MSENKTAGKAAKKDGAVKKLLAYMKPMWGLLILILFMSLLSAFFNVLVPNYTQNIVNEIRDGMSRPEGIDFGAVWQLVLWAALFLGAGYLCGLIQALISPSVSLRTAQRMRKDINEKANRIPLNYFDTNPEGETLSTMTNDVDTLSTSLGNTLPQIMSAAATFIGCLVLMFVTDPLMAIITIVATVLGMLASVALMAKGAPYFKKNQDGLARVNAMINEDFKGHLVIKSFGAEQEIIDAFRKSNADLYDSTWKSQFISSLLAPISMFAGNLGYIAVCVSGALLAFNGHTSVGTIIAFIQFASMFSSPISTLAQAGGKLQPAVAASSRIFDMLEQPEMEDSGKAEIETDKVRGVVDFEHVKFGYVPENIIVKDFSLHVEAGQKVAIVGPTGAGKSTLVNLLTRFYELNGGEIKIDGTPINEMPRERLHDLISMVLQDTWTFEGSIRDNIVYAKKNVAEEQLKKVCSDAGLDGFLSTFSDGVDTMLGEDCGVSAGQKQLITIARAMLDDSPILILDEATSSIDTRTEKIISQAIDKLMAGRTSFVIAHRLSTIRNANVILVLKDGDIIETGTHEELMAKKGFYADLYMSQFDAQTA